MRPHWGLALTVYVAVAAGPAAAQAPVTQAPPSFEVVALPGEGTIVSGSAAPGATVHVLDRERVVATAIANRRGEWAIGLANELSPGSYRLAVRVTAPDGGEAVISDRRIALVVPEPGTAAPSAALPDKIVVQEGDNLWFIARRLYGSGIYFDLLFDANRGIISSPRAIFPGQVLAVPIAPSLPH